MAITKSENKRRNVKNKQRSVKNKQRSVKNKRRSVKNKRRSVKPKTAETPTNKGFSGFFEPLNYLVI
jgi:hypothetical protein